MVQWIGSRTWWEVPAYSVSQNIQVPAGFTVGQHPPGRAFPGKAGNMWLKFVVKGFGVGAAIIVRTGSLDGSEVESIRKIMTLVKTLDDPFGLTNGHRAPLGLSNFISMTNGHCETGSFWPDTPGLEVAISHDSLYPVSNTQWTDRSSGAKGSCRVPSLEPV